MNQLNRYTIYCYGNKHITELEALEFVKKQNHKDEWHKDFHLWRKHLIILANKWPQLKQFYRGSGKWL